MLLITHKQVTSTTFALWPVIEGPFQMNIYYTDLNVEATWPVWPLPT